MLAGAAAAAVLLCQLHPQHTAPPADPCATVGPIDVIGYQVLPQITVCP